MDSKSMRDLIIESGLQLIPYVGGSLSTLYFGTKQEKRFLRLESFYADISETLSELNRRIADIKVHDEDSLAAIIETVNERIEEEHIQTKREFYKRFFINTLYSPVTQSNFEKRKSFLDCLKALSTLHFELLVFLKQQNQPVPDKTITHQNCSKAEVFGALNQLRLYGLIESEGVSIDMSQGGKGIYEFIVISDYGREFHNFCIN